jgi:peptide deformylase
MTSEESQKHILKLNLHPHDALRQVIPETDLKQDLEWDKIANLMHTTMEAAGGLGLAANQVSVGIRMFVMRERKSFINPKVVEFSKTTTLTEEGCLSFPNLFMTVERPEWVVVEWYDEQLKKSVDRFTNIWAKCIQHEIDHLDGKLFIDRVSKFKYERAKKKQGKLNDRTR